jgi:DNA-binding Lrp family transcriptional regulator
MIIDLIDLKIIRELESGKRMFPDLAIKKLSILKEEFFSRLARLEATRLIKSYKASIFIPPLLGGDWFLGGGVGITANPEKVTEQITQGLPFAVEVWHNFAFPSGIGPNLSFSFYSKDFPSSTQFLKEIKELDYLEIYKLREYSFPVPFPLSAAEKKLLREINVAPTISLETLANIINQDISWIQEKLNRLITNPNCIDAVSNTDFSIMQILPELNWRVCENFCHTHFIIEPYGSKSQVPNSDFQIVLDGRTYREKFYQLESDLWGLNQLASKLKIIQQSNVNIKGLTFAESNLIINHWVPNLLV